MFESARSAPIIGIAACLAALLVFGTVGAAGPDAEKADETKETPEAAKLPEKLVITAIPDDSDQGRMRENFGYIAELFEKETGIPCEYVHVRDYSASVTALATDQAQIVWLGAITMAQARIKMGDDVVAIGCRDIDKGFVSYFIANADLGIEKVDDLAELAKLAKGKDWTLTFGSKSSTTSHMMPRHFFSEQSDETVEQVFKTVTYSGRQDVVIAKVASGDFHIGAVGQAPYDRAEDDVKAKAPIIYTTPAFYNYGFAARSELGEDVLKKLTDALLKAHESDNGKKVLSYLRAEKFIDADIKEWQPYVDILESGVDIGG